MNFSADKLFSSMFRVCICIYIRIYFTLNSSKIFQIFKCKMCLSLENNINKATQIPWDRTFHLWIS